MAVSVPGELRHDLGRLHGRQFTQTGPARKHDPRPHHSKAQPHGIAQLHTHRTMTDEFLYARRFRSEP